MQSGLKQIPLIMQWSRQVTNAEILISLLSDISKVRLQFMLVMNFTSASFVLSLTHYFSVVLPNCNVF